jgi:hypothetical protein
VPLIVITESCGAEDGVKEVMARETGSSGTWGVTVVLSSFLQAVSRQDATRVRSKKLNILFIVTTLKNPNGIECKLINSLNIS